MVKKFFSPLCLLISVFLLIYIVFKSELVWVGEKRDYYLPYFIFAIFLFIFSIISFFFSKESKTIFLKISSIAIFFLFLCESVLLFKNIINQKKVIRESNNFNLFENLKKEEKEIAITFSPWNFINENNKKYIPLSGLSKIKTIHCLNQSGYTNYESDRYGFNNPDKEWDAINIKYLLIGDVFTHSGCVNRPHDIASVLRTLSNEPVLNLGYEGNETIIMFSTLKEYLPKKVENILWMYHEGNDTDEIEIELKNQILLKYLYDDNFIQNLKSNQNKIDEIVKNSIKKFLDSQKKVNKFSFEKLRIVIRFLKLSNLREELFYKEKRELFTPPHPMFKKILENTKKISKNNKSNFYFVYLPEYLRFTKDYQKNTQYKKIKKIIEDSNIKFIDIKKEIFDKSEDPEKLFSIKNTGMYNEEGYKKIAEYIFKLTKE